MEIREFAETIYTGGTLAEKLTSAATFSDADPGKKWERWDVPARPAKLGLKEPGQASRFAFPKLHELEDDVRRGHALHFFANHELLALELMALVLLRFPDVDPVFRKTLVSTMQDEQRHLKLYLDRMGELGVGFGEIGVNSFFFDHIADVPTPNDFVVRMSLTFEQANLDFSLYFAEAFQTIGDSETESIMRSVLHDEIAHVAHGLRWFKEWNGDDEPLWEAYRRQLPYPLTPARAKGLKYYSLPRERAGLPADFIQRLRVYSHSKGRTPDVWIFNPDCEEQCAKPDGSYSPNRQVDAMQRDLELLPLFFAKSDDVVLVRQEPSPSFLGGLIDAGFQVPEIVEFGPKPIVMGKKHSLVQRRVRKVQPWGWDPKVARQLHALDSGGPRHWLASEERGPSLVFSKAWMAQHYERLLAEIPNAGASPLLPAPAPRVATNLDEATRAIDRFLKAGATRVVVKAPWGTSGRRNIRVEAPGPDAKQLPWMNKVLRSQGSLVVEPSFDRVFDLSYQFTVNSDGSVGHQGVTRTMNDANGRFRGVVLGRPYEGLDETARRFIYQSTDDPGWVERTLGTIASNCAMLCHGEGYAGPAGIDSMVVRHKNGLALRPLVEVNVRHTMGQVGMALSRRLGSATAGLWLLFNRRDIEKAGMTTFNEVIGVLQDRLPFWTEDQGAQKIRRGVVATNDPQGARHVQGLILAAPKMEEVSQVLQDLGLRV